MPTGTHNLADLLANRESADRRVLDFGEVELLEYVRPTLAAHNRIVLDMLTTLTERTVLSQKTYGADTASEMKEADEHGRVPTTKDSAKAQVAFPLRLFKHGVGFTEEYLLRATVRDVAEKTAAAQRAHLRALRRAIGRALFTPTNETFVDWMVDSFPLVIRRLVNGDGQPIPSSEAGTNFDPDTHTHYRGTNATSGQALADAVAALVQTVTEHDHVDDVRISISEDDEATFRALPGFLPLSIDGIISAITGDRAVETEEARYTDKVIGRLGKAKVQTRSWVPASYAFCAANGDPGKPLAFREDPQVQLQGLRISAPISLNPLRAEYYDARFGFGGNTRTNGACLNFDADNDNVYEAPSTLLF